MKTETTMTQRQQIMTANTARMEIYKLADIYSWETIGREMICRMSGDEARSFVEDFENLYSSSIIEDEDAE
jgi:hypothetical protein